MKQLLTIVFIGLVFGGCKQTPEEILSNIKKEMGEDPIDDKCYGDCENGLGGKKITLTNRYTFIGETFIGEWKDGKMAKGTLFVKGNNVEYKYEGLFKDDLFIEGTITHPDGSMYVGSFIKGKQSMGTFTNANGDKYKGMFEEGGCFHGYGTYTYANGDVYEGVFYLGKMKGQGTYTFGKGRNEGDTYVGEWKDDMKHGYGTYTYANGDKYVGEFKYNKKRGQGIFTDINGGVLHSGFWKNDKPINK